MRLLKPTKSQPSYNIYKNETLHVWYVLAFTKETATNDLKTILSGIINGLQTFAIENPDVFGIRAKVVVNSTYITPAFEDIIKLSQFFVNITIDRTGLDTQNVNLSNEDFKKRLSFIPWGGPSGSLGPKRIGILSTIILTNYAPTFFNGINDEGQTLEGTLYAYSSEIYEQYRDTINDSSLFHIFNSSFVDPIFVNPLGELLQSTTVKPSTRSKITSMKSTSLTPSSRTTTNFKTSATSLMTTIASSSKENSLNTTAKILIISGSTIIILFLFVAGFTIYCKRKHRRKIFENLLASHGNHSKRDLHKSTMPKLDYWELTWAKLVITKEELASGAYGRILNGKLTDIPESEFRKNGAQVAIKVPNNNITKESFLHEINLMKQISGQKNIVKMIGCITTGDRICLVLEFCANLDLLKYVKNKKDTVVNEKRNKKEFIIFAWQISHGLQYLSSKGIIHRDIAARNILIDGDKNAKITDFGLSIQQNKNIKKQYITSGHGKLPIKWLAIESLKNQEFSFKTDIWTFGIMLYEMYSYGEVPYSDIYVTELLAYLEEGNRIKKPEDCPDEIYALMSKCWMQNPSERPTVDELIKGFTTHLKHSTEEYGYLDLLENSNNKKMKKRFIQRFTSTESSSSYV